MTSDDITRKLALLPEGIAESNLQSWENVVSFYKSQIDYPIGNILPNNFYDKALLVIYDLVRDFSKTRQAKLFRAGQSVNDLLISTANKHELMVGDLFIRTTFDESHIIIQYEVGSPITIDEDPTIIKGISGDLSDNLMLALQPLLNLLWNETRGKKNI